MGATLSRHAAEGLNLYAQCWPDASLSHVQRHGAQWVGCDGSDPLCAGGKLPRTLGVEHRATRISDLCIRKLRQRRKDGLVAAAIDSESGGAIAMPKAIVKDAIKVGVDVSRGIMVHAKGGPAQIVAVGAAAGVALLATAVSYAAIQGVQSLIRRGDD